MAQPNAGDQSAETKIDPALPGMIGTTTVISASELDRYGMRTAAEAIEFLSLGMTATQPLHASELGARGVLLSGDGGGHVLIAVDGHGVNEAWRGSAYADRGLAIPLELIERIEITLGPGSVRYGNHAVLGVVNVITKRAKQFPGVHLIVESELVKSIRGAAGAGVEFNFAGRDGEFVLEVDYFSQGGQNYIFGPQNYGIDSISGEPKRFSEQGNAAGIWGGVQERPYSIRVPSVSAFIRWGDIEFRARANSYFRDSPYISPIAQLHANEDDTNRNELDELLSVDLRYQRQIAEAWTLWGRLYGDFYGFTRSGTSSALEDCYPDQTSGCRRVLGSRSRWGGLEAQAFYRWDQQSRHRLMLGLDLTGVYAQSALELRDIAADIADASRSVKSGEAEQSTTSLILFAEQRSFISDWATLYAGLRADFISTAGAHLSPRAEIGVNLWEGAWLKTTYTEAFHPASVFAKSHADPRAMIPTPGLEAETVRSVELSMEQNYGRQRAYVGAYRSFWDQPQVFSALTDEEFDEASGSGQWMGAKSPTGAYRFRNAASLEQWGLLASYEANAMDKRLQFGAKLTRAYTRLDEGKGWGALPVTVSPQLFGNARISYRFDAPYPTVSMAAGFSGPAPADRAFDGGFESNRWTSSRANLRLTALGYLPWVRGLSYRVSVNVGLGDNLPYVIGPVQRATPLEENAELAPVERFRVAAALRYDLMQN